tara:strand:- start:1841 stop:2845 length:1005 start_codon:yes stop_codon:yes gene_type:complete
MKFYLKLILSIALLFFAAMSFIFIYEVTCKDHDDDDYYDFSLNDTSSITKILIWDKSPDTVFLSRQKNNQWIVNNSFKARPDAIEVLLETIYRIRLRNFPQKSALPRILKTMATYGKHVDLYIDNKIVKSFTVGTETPDQLGTYMLMDDFETPVATHIPGFNGYLSSRFFIREDLWRKREIWPYEKEIISVEVSYPDSTSFKLIKENNQFSLIGPSGINLSADDMSSQAFLKGIRKAQYEGMIIPTDKAWDKSDSIQLTPPVGIFKVTYIDGNIIEMKIHRVPGGPDWLDSEGRPQRYDPDRYYAFISDGRFVLTQRFGLQHVLKSYRAFLTFE